jgi:hypothetical protein
MSPYEIDETIDFEKGREAFLGQDDHLLYQCTPGFLWGYKEAYMEWACKEYPRAAANPDSSHLEAYWDAHYDEAVTNMRERLLAKVLDTPKTKIAKANTKAQVRSFVLGSLATLGFVLIALAPWLMTAEEVANFWKEVFR